MSQPRYAFALTLPKSLQQQIGTWRARHFADDVGYPVASSELRLVLAWLGEPSPGQLSQLQQRAANIIQPGFSLTLNDAGYWHRSGQIWIGSRPAPRGLLQLGNLLRSQAAQLGCPQPATPFLPVVTLLRQVTSSPRLPAPGFSWSVALEAFELIASHYRRGSSSYKVVASYPLSRQESD